MAILEYHPPKQKLLDNRNENGGYYTAKCENCGTTFYPLRSNARYCTPNCGLIQHRIAVANGTAMKRSGKIEKPKDEVSIKDKITFRGAEEVYNFLMSNEKTKSIVYRRKMDFIQHLKDLSIEDYLQTTLGTVVRISKLNYQWIKGI